MRPPYIVHTIPENLDPVREDMPSTQKDDVQKGDGEPSG